MRITLDKADWERIDRLAKRLYETERGGTVELLLAANPGLAALALKNSGYLPRGLVINVPPAPVSTTNTSLTRPWQ
ncbi:tail protein X [Methylobacterium radiotolerans]|uniref:tail protein X n=1 Tax=Methylobacterium radiotolerans TaxID=31998 RepID=UPI001F3E2896|nr:tail protein X [Methylobacterium radiotolerans]UIY44158.1 tail protein X [Methylobacterium radiotolerans]